MRKLKNTLLRIIFLSLCAVVLFSQCCYASSVENTTQAGLSLTPAQSTELLTMLEQQETALTEALSLIEQAQTELDESNQELMSCQQELEKQKQELTSLRKTLMEQRNELDLASKSIKSANDSLVQARLEMLENDKKHKAKESQLRKERTLWQIVTVVLGGVCAAK